MAYNEHSVAYDLDLFKDNAAKKIPEKQNTKDTENKVVKISEEDTYRIRRRKHNPFKIFVGSISATVATVIIAAIIVGQAQLTELNQQIITAQETLENAQSTYTQLQMGIQSKLSTTEIEKYAETKLGMSKTENAQKEFVSLSQGDKAEISGEANLNFFQKIINAITGLWS